MPASSKTGELLFRQTLPVVLSAVEESTARESRKVEFGRVEGELVSQHLTLSPDEFKEWANALRS